MADNPNTPGERMEVAMNRALASIGRLYDKEPKLNALLARLKEAQIKTDECFRETERRIEGRTAETDRLLQESGEQLDARIDKLVSAIGEFIRISGSR